MSNNLTHNGNKRELEYDEGMLEMLKKIKQGNYFMFDHFYVCLEQPVDEYPMEESTSDYQSPSTSKSKVQSTQQTNDEWKSELEELIKRGEATVRIFYLVDYL